MGGTCPSDAGEVAMENMEYLIIIKGVTGSETDYTYRIISFRCNQQQTATDIVGLLDDSDLTVYAIHDPPKRR
jgi:hypothetical protein